MEDAMAGHIGMQDSLVGHTSMQKIWQADQTSEQNPLAGRTDYQVGHTSREDTQQQKRYEGYTIRKTLLGQTNTCRQDTQTERKQVVPKPDSQDDCATKRRITERRITKCRISKRRIAQCRIEKRRITKRRILQNVESYKTSNLAESRNTKRRILQNLTLTLA